jgi:hypothetical protein
MSMKQVNSFHMLLMGPTMIYVGTLSKNKLSMKATASNNFNIIDIAFKLIIFYAILIPFVVSNDFLSVKMDEWTQRQWINITHYIVFMGLFLYIGTRGRTISKPIQILAVIIGVAQITIHFYKYVYVNSS